MLTLVGFISLNKACSGEGFRLTLPLANSSRIPDIKLRSLLSQVIDNVPKLQSRRATILSRISSKRIVSHEDLENVVSVEVSKGDFEFSIDLELVSVPTPVLLVP